MTRRYGHAITVTITHAGSLPTGFHWNGTAYRVVEVLATWHLRDRWWETGETASTREEGDAHTSKTTMTSMTPAPPAAARPSSPSDRHYYRLRCASGLICEIYHDSTSDVWVLDTVYD